MAKRFEDTHNIAWCPGCGNFAIRSALMGALEDLGYPNEEVVMVSGIGQAAKMPQYIRSHYFNGLHGRALPVATAIKAVNPGLVVIAEGGDGDMYGEGGNHLLHAIRRNPDITLFVHDNMVYGLTKGQASPTSREGMVTPVQVEGVFEKPINPVALAVAMDAPFVARAISGDIEGTRDIMRQAMLHKGLSIVDIFQPCVTFNKVNSMQWYRDNSRSLEDGYDPTDRDAALKCALEEMPFPVGVIYRNDGRKSFEESLAIYGRNPRPLVERFTPLETVRELLRELS
jgi:2-oxoglutarate ferredoxin oxidoreductase subunit beta